MGKMKHTKGESGYLIERQKHAWMWVIGFAAVIAALLIAGVLIWGSNENILTVVAVVLVLPAAHFTVNLIMLAPKKPSSRQIIELTDAAAPDLRRLYDLVIGTSKKPAATHAVVLADSAVVIYVTDDSVEPDFLQKQVDNFLHGDSIFVHVDVYKSQDKFLNRIRFLEQSLEKSGKGLRQERVDKIQTSLLAMCL